MKKASVVVILFLFSVFTVSAASFSPFSYTSNLYNGKGVLDAGLGFGMGLDVHGSYEMRYPVQAGKYTLPLSFGGSLDVAIDDGINFSILGRVAWHMALAAGIPLDLYLGVALGVKAVHAEQELIDGFKNPILNFGMDTGCYLGVRYFFSSTEAIFLEGGYTGLTWAKLGLSFMINR